MTIDSNSLSIQSKSNHLHTNVAPDCVVIHYPNSKFKLKKPSEFYLRADEISVTEVLDDEDFQNSFCFSDQTVTGYKIYTKYIRGVYLKIIVGHGLYVKITLCKLFFKHNLYSLSVFDIAKAFEEAKKMILELVDLDFESGIITKIDLFRNIETQYPINVYELIFIWLNGNWQAVSHRYPTSFYWMNTEKILVIYDKLAELAAQLKNQDTYLKGRGDAKNKIDNYFKNLEITNLLKRFEGRNFIRIETRLYTKKLVKDFLGVETVGELLAKQTPALYEQAFISQIRRMVLCKAPELSQKLEFHSQLELLKQCQKQFKNRAVANFDSLMGLPSFLEGLGSIKQYKALLEAAGYSKSDVSKYLKQRRELLELSRSIDGAVYPTGSTPALYKEFFDKALEMKYAPQ